MKINKIECDRCKYTEDVAAKTEAMPKDWFELFQHGVTWHLCLACAQRALEKPPKEKGGEG